MGDTITFIVMLFNLFVSLWNAYSSGYNSVILEKVKNIKFREFFSISNSFGLVLSFAGATYSIAYFLSLILSHFGYISPQVSLLISSYSFLVFGFLITFCGIMIAIETILVAYLSRNLFAVILSVFNVIISIFNLYTYISSFSYVHAISEKLGEDEDSRIKAILVLLVAALISFFLVYAFYTKGKGKAEKEMSGVHF